MEIPFPFKSQHRQEGAALLKQQALKQVLFSEGTYQLEIYDEGTPISFWPFFQLNDVGEIHDYFCTCDDAGRDHSCAHLAAAYLFIHQHCVPLHVRFRCSFWRSLCMIAFLRYGTSMGSVKQIGEQRYECRQEEREEAWCFLTAITESGKQLIDEVILYHLPETEESSLKFSNLAYEELESWHRGEASLSFRYELSFWSDLAKWMMMNQEFSQGYQIECSTDGEHLPKEITLRFNDLLLSMALFEEDWISLIPSCDSVCFPFLVYECRSIVMHSLTYDPGSKALRVGAEPLILPKSPSPISAGEWDFFPTIGFVPKAASTVFERDVIPEHEIGSLLTEHYLTVVKYLKGTKITPIPREWRYHLFFDQKRALHIICFVYFSHDLLETDSALFPPWAYLPEEGFICLKERPFNQVETIIPRDQVESFIKEQMLWLGEREGFEVHHRAIELSLIYHFDGKTLSFGYESLDIESPSDDLLDFGRWLYVKDKGFYQKSKQKGAMALKTDTTIPLKDISQFVIENQEVLEHVKHFFSAQCPIQRVGVEIILKDKRRIDIFPRYIYLPGYQEDNVKIVGRFVYYPQEGFSKIPLEGRIPERYRHRVKMMIHEKEFAHFVEEDLPKLESSIVHKDLRLQKPSSLHLQINRVTKKRGPSSDWRFDLSYVSDLGKVGLRELRKAIDLRWKYVPTQAGLIQLTSSRFDWLKGLKPAQFSGEKGQISLSLVEWIQLTAMEPVQAGSDPKTRQWLEQIRQLSVDKCDLTGFNSQLRPYQIKGVEWLWSLHTYKLSGFLCDEMGLGKTHQAMGLMAAISNSCRRRKTFHYLIVCPTSVLYHWENLLHQFLPSLPVKLFYGTRRIRPSVRNKGAVLTSYGLLRHEKKIFASFSFDLAIFDEIQLAKNPHSHTHRSLVDIQAHTKIGLTGTPIENHIMELRALFEIVLPGYLPPEKEYQKMFMHPVEKEGNADKKQQLQTLIHPFILRRSKEEVLSELPEKIEEVVFCSLSDEQKHLYRQAVLRAKEQLTGRLKKDGTQAQFHLFSLFNKLKQICDHPCMITKDLDHYEAHRSGKWSLFIELLSESRESGKKLVVFTQYLDMMHILESYLKKHRIGYAAIRGSTKNRKEEVERFQNNPSCEVFVASLKAGGVGIDLTSASVVIHYDRWWNAAKEDQATDRVHRIGQNRGVQVFYMVTKGSIEEHINQMIQKKKRLLEKVIHYDDQHREKQFQYEDLLLLYEKVHKDFSA